MTVFIYFNIISIKTFYIENIIEKGLCSFFYIYIFDFITHFLIYLLIHIFLIRYLRPEIVINVFAFLDFYQITVNTNSYQ